jgi:hypothetical protein
MKKSGFILLLSLLSFFRMQAQAPFEVDFGWGGYPMYEYDYFEDNSLADHFYFDSTQTGNLWQIGKSLKAGFSATQGLRALMTDTSMNYPAGNVSSFYMKTINYTASPGMGTQISFYQRYNTDLNIDGGTIEISHDNGSTWMNVINDPMLMASWGGLALYSSTDTIQSLGQQPGFSGSSGSSPAHVTFGIDAAAFGPDTLLFRFTFASDSIDTNKPGWLIDALEIMAPGEGIEEYDNNGLISVFPNPVANEIRFSSQRKFKDPFGIRIYDPMGRLSLGQTAKENEAVDVSALKSGIYYCVLSNGNFYSGKKIIVQK